MSATTGAEADGGQDPADRPLPHPVPQAEQLPLWLCQSHREALEYDTRGMSEEIYHRSETGYAPSPAELRTRILAQLAQLREQAGMRSNAEHLTRQAADNGNPNILLTLAESREQSGDSQDALRLCRLAANYPYTRALSNIAGLLERTGCQYEAEQLRRNGLADDGSAAATAPWI